MVEVLLGLGAICNDLPRLWDCWEVEHLSLVLHKDCGWYFSQDAREYYVKLEAWKLEAPITLHGGVIAKCLSKL